MFLPQDTFQIFLFYSSRLCWFDPLEKLSPRRPGGWADNPGRRRGRKSLRLQLGSGKVSARLGSPGDKAGVGGAPQLSEGVYIRTPGAGSNPESVALGSENPHGRNPIPTASPAPGHSAGAPIA